MRAGSTDLVAYNLRQKEQFRVHGAGARGYYSLQYRGNHLQGMEQIAQKEAINETSSHLMH